MNMLSSNFDIEIKTEASLRKFIFLIPLINIFTATVLYLGICYCHYLFEKGYWGIVLLAALLAHAFFIVVVHDAGHESVTRTKIDRWWMNIGAGMMLLPFYGEFFRKYHLLHHWNTNTEEDPLWPEQKRILFERYRFFYFLCEWIPLLFTFYLIFLSNRKKTKINHRQREFLKVNWGFIGMAAIITIIIAYLLQPNWIFLLSTLFILSLLSKLRHWCEHLGTAKNKSSNTFWFPLGMGIGNHEAHHFHPQLSFISLSYGLWRRPKDTNPFKTIFQLLFNKNFKHYSKEDKRVPKHIDNEQSQKNES